MVLDITFYEENKLVDQEFPEDCSPFKIQQLLQDLTEPEILAGKLAPAQEVCIFVFVFFVKDLLTLNYFIYLPFGKADICLHVNCIVLMGASCAMIGAICVGPGAAGMPLLETWGSVVHVLSYPSSKKTVD